MTENNYTAGEDLTAGSKVFIDAEGRVRGLPVPANEGALYVDDESCEFVFGAVRLRKMPTVRLVDAEGFSLPENPTREQYDIAAAWITVRGGRVPYICDEGMLVQSCYPAGDSYWEFIRGGGLIVFNSQHREFTSYGSTVMTDYAIERLS